jgi:hypothetical protein
VDMPASNLRSACSPQESDKIAAPSPGDQG